MRLKPLVPLGRRRFLQIMRNRLIPWVRESADANILLAEPPFLLPPTATLTRHDGPPLKEEGESKDYYITHSWPQQEVHATRGYYLAVVLEGEVDWRIGITEAMAARAARDPLGQAFTNADYCVLNLRPKTFFLMPPGVPYSISKPHWEGANLESAHSVIFYIQVWGSGAYCHTCTTRGHEHFGDPVMFVPDRHLLAVTNLLVRELRERLPHRSELVRLQLLSLLLSVDRALDRKTMMLRTDSLPRPAAGREGTSAQAITVQEACAYMEANLQLPLTLATIAAQVSLSGVHLNRLFQQELETSVMKYLVERRIETAQGLLVGSEIPIKEVGRMVGYPNASHFNQVFARMSDQSPGEYREKFRRG